MRHWNRGRKTVRNFLLALLLVFLVYASQGFPPYTVQGMCRQMQNDYLLEDLEPLYAQRDWLHYTANKYQRRTMVAARSGETYTIFRYEDSLLGSHLDWSDLSPVFGEGAVCTARNGTIYAAGPFENAATAAIVVRTERKPESGGSGSSPWRGSGWRSRCLPSPMKWAIPKAIGRSRKGSRLRTSTPWSWSWETSRSCGIGSPRRTRAPASTRCWMKTFPAP